MKKIIILFFLITAASVEMMAQSFDYMQFSFSSGGSQYFKSSGLEITFSDGNAVVVSLDGTTTLPLSSLTSMVFVSDPSSIIYRTMDGDTSDIELFTVEGISMGRFKSMQEACNKLCSGLYIVRQNSKTFKTTLQ